MKLWLYSEFIQFCKEFQRGMEIKKIYAFDGAEKHPVYFSNTHVLLKSIFLYHIAVGALGTISSFIGKKVLQSSSVLCPCI